MYGEWADTQINRVKNILNAARQDHTEAVKSRIENVKQMEGVVDITKALFEVSKVFDSVYLLGFYLTCRQETAQLEAKAYELGQTTALVDEARSVLDSWVRYEGQVRQRQQHELAKSIIAKVKKELSNPKVTQEILQQSLTDVESIHMLSILFRGRANTHTEILSSKAQ